jgi:hypothetical protein
MMRIHKTTLLARAIASVVVISSCRFVGDPPSAIVRPGAVGTDLFISPGTIEIARGFQSSETVSARLAGGQTPDIIWSIDDTTIVAVTALDSHSARLSARRGGTTTVSARTRDGVHASATVVVTDQPPTKFDPVEPRQVTVDGITVSATTRADSEPAGAPLGAVLYTTTVTLRNGGASDRTIQLGACSVWMTVHAGGGWYMEEMRPLAWDQLRSAHACEDEPKSVTLPSHASYSASTSVFAHDLIGQGVPANNRYYFHAHTRFDTTQVVVQADSAVITYPSNDLVATATTEILTKDTTQSLRTVVTLTNRGELPAHLEYGACATRVLAYLNPERTGSPRWDSNLRRPWEGTYGFGCAAYLAIRDVKPGAVFSPGEFTLVAPLIEMVGDSLPDGHYYFAADVGFSNRVPIRGIPAGDANISVGRGALPTTRVADLLTYRALPVSVAGSPAQITARVTATLDYAGSALVNFSRDCPVLLYAYRDRTRRDAAPRAGAADWSQAMCGTQQQQVVMNRGETRTLSTTVAVGNLLGSSLPAGHYYFAVSVQAEGNRVFLSAGEADLSR